MRKMLIVCLSLLVFLLMGCVPFGEDVAGKGIAVVSDRYVLSDEFVGDVYEELENKAKEYENKLEDGVSCKTGISVRNIDGGRVRSFRGRRTPVSEATSRSEIPCPKCPMQANVIGCYEVKDFKDEYISTAVTKIDELIAEENRLFGFCSEEGYCNGEQTCASLTKCEIRQKEETSDSKTKLYREEETDSTGRTIKRVCVKYENYCECGCEGTELKITGERTTKLEEGSAVETDLKVTGETEPKLTEGQTTKVTE